MYMRDPFNYTHSVQVASNKPNNQVDKRRQRYFDSTSYNYQQYYTHDGKLNYSNTANSSAITMWLESYDDLRVRLVFGLISLINNFRGLYRPKRHTTDCWANFRVPASSATQLKLTMVEHRS